MKPRIGIAHLPHDFLEEAEVVAQSEHESSAALADARLSDIEASAVAAALKAHGGNVSAAARAGRVAYDAVSENARLVRGYY